jgi:hypothetical protein
MTVGRGEVGVVWVEQFNRKKEGEVRVDVV